MIFTALITPFKKDKIDEEGFLLLLERQLEAGIDGVVIAGSTGEGSTLSEEETNRLVFLAVKHVKGQLKVFVGTGTDSTKETIERTKVAKELGADGALIVPSYYNRPTQEGIFRHFESITKAVDFPIIVYNHPGRCGVNIDFATMRQIALLPSIIGVKDCSGQLVLISDYLTIPGFMVLSGDDILTLPIMSLGGGGVISIVGNLLPEEMKSLVRQAKKGNFFEAQKKHFELLPLFHATNIETNPIPIKAAMEIYDLPSGGLRLPLCGLQKKNRERVEDVLKKYKVANCLV